MTPRRRKLDFCTAALIFGAAVLFPLVAGAQSDRPETTAVFSTQTDFELVDFELADVVHAEWPELLYDGGAARAARAYASISAEGGATILASDDLREILADAGLPESTAVCAVVSTTEEGFDDVLDHLRVVMSTAGEVTHIGLGRAKTTMAPFRWLWTILLVERRIDLVTPVPRRLSPENATPLRFRLRDGWQQPRVLVRYPGGLTRRMSPVDEPGGWFTVIPVGRESGEITLQVFANGPFGPRVAAQMPIQVSAVEMIHEKNTGPSAPKTDESAITNSRSAEAHIFANINSTRALSGLTALEWDDGLSEVARAHSVDMVANGFFGHVSPTRGDMKQRLREAGLTTTVARENVARDTKLTDAHGSLMASPGHRSNVLAADVDRLGVGVVIEARPGAPDHWVVTEIYARLFAPPSIEAVLQRRQTNHPTACRRNLTLDELAAWFVTAAPPSAEIDGPTFEELKRRLDATGIGWVRMSTELAVVRTIDEVAGITKVDQRQYSICGMAARTIESTDGRSAVLLAVVLIEPR